MEPMSVRRVGLDGEPILCSRPLGGGARPALGARAT
jgi:hypothetical protein